MLYQYFICPFILSLNVVLGHPRNLAWSGGPVHVECEHGVELFTQSGQYVRDNVIAIKAVTFREEIYVITPRLKHGVLATVSLLVRGRTAVELQAFPELSTHTLGDCTSIQNAVDFHLDHLGNLWILDSGIVETLEQPRCTCTPKVVVISILLKRQTKHIALTSVEATSLLQNVVIEYGIGGKAYVYISDASRGAIVVHDTSSGSEWLVLACAPAASLQIALVKRGPAHAVLVLVRLHHPGLLELDTAALRRRNSRTPLSVFGDNTKPVLLLGSDAHHVYLRHTECTDVLSWNTREAFNASRLVSIHSPGPRLAPTSVAADPLKHILLVLDSNYADTVHATHGTYHRISFIGQF